MPNLKLADLEIGKKDGVMVFILREDGSREVHFPQLGRLSEGQLEQSQMLFYRGLMVARSNEARKAKPGHPDIERY